MAGTSSLRSRPIPSIIQGVSQQTPQSRRDAQCEAQQDCFNNPTLGVVARNGADLQQFIAGLQIPNAFTYEIIRGGTEHYLVILYQGSLTVWDLNTFTLTATVTGTNFPASVYITPPVGVSDRDNFVMQSVGDFHFIANKSVAPLMVGSAADPASLVPGTEIPALSPSQGPQAIVFFQAGQYLTTYVVTVEYAGTLYTFSYQTPDNSVGGNFAYIQTNQLAATFFRAMTGNVATTPGSGTGSGVGSSGLDGVTGAAYTSGAGSGNVVGATTLTSLGFTVVIEGNLLLVQRQFDNNPFTVDATDGSGDQAITVIQNSVATLSDLPRGGFEGFLIKVNGVANNSVNAPYYLTFNSTAANGGAWVETVAGGTPQYLDPYTMPLALFCSAPDTFELVQPNWLARISGDGLTSAFDPGFVGKFIVDMLYFNGRLGIETASTMDFSAANNPYNWWPETATSSLDTDPISLEVAASSTTAVLQRAVVVDEQVTLWAQRVQFRLNTGVLSFTAQNIQNPESTNYEFNPNCPFVKLGVRLYFVYEAAGWASIYILQYQNGRAVGDTDIAAHIPSYIPAGTRGIAVDVPDKLLFVRSDGAPNQLYLYNYLEEGGSVVQSAWNTWNLPDGEILWHGVYQRQLYAVLQRPEGLCFLTVPLHPAYTDPGGAYSTRLDMRLTESDLLVGLPPPSPPVAPPVPPIWISRTPPAGHLIFHAINEDGNAVLLASNGPGSVGAVYLSKDRGFSWPTLTAFSTRNWISGAISSNGLVIAAVAVDGNVYTSTDGGATVTAVAISGASQLTQIAMSGSGGTILVADNSIGKFWVSANGGTSYTLVLSHGAPTTAHVAVSRDGTVQLINCNPLGLLLSGNNFGSSTNVSPGSTALGNTTFLSANGRVIYAADNFSRFWRSTTQGSGAWTLLPAPHQVEIGGLSDDGATITLSDLTSNLTLFSDDFGVTLAAQSPPGALSGSRGVISGDKSLAMIRQYDPGTIYTITPSP